MEEDPVDARCAIGAFALFAVAFGGPRHAAAEGAGGVGVVTTLRGEATVARVTLTQPLALRTHDDVLQRDRITTQERSLVHVLLGTRALLTVRELSVLTITEGAARATTDLQSGKVGLAVARQRMKPGDVIEVQTPNVLVAVRGTVLVVEIVPAVSGAQPASSPAAITTMVYLLHGSVDVSLRNDLTAPPVHLKSLQAVEVSGNTLGTVRSLSPEAVAAATRGLTANDLLRPGPPAAFLSALVAQQQTLATGALTRGSIRDTVDRAANTAGRTSGFANGIGLSGGTGAAATNGIRSGASVSTLPPMSVPTDLLTGK
jgi:FecR protein